MTKKSSISGMKKKPRLLSRFFYSDQVAGYVFLCPFILNFLLFTFVPIFISLYYSFTDYKIAGTAEWVGLKNYITMFTADFRFWNSLGITAVYTFISVPLKLIFALIVALILNRNSKVVGIYRSMYYLPTMVGGSIAVAVTWKLMFQKYGLINSILNAVGIRSEMSWLSNPDTALGTLILLTVWQYGTSMVIFLAGLKQIPAQYYEAATVDGANKITSFFKITLPLLSPILFFNLVMQVISGFIAFTQAYVITEGGPANATLMYVLYIYRQGFSGQKMGYACALAWIMLLIVAFFTAIIFKSSNSWVYYESTGAKKGDR